MIAGRTKAIRFAAPASRPAAGLRVAPLVDIVFLLICFYLLVTQLINEQEDPSVQLATMTNEVAQMESPAEIIVNLLHGDEITLAGRLVSTSEVRTLLIEQNKRARPAEDGGLRVVIRADRREPARRLLEMIRLCRQVGVSYVIHRTVGEGAP